jgi:hypothetical protein
VYCDDPSNFLQKLTAIGIDRFNYCKAHANSAGANAPKKAYFLHQDKAGLMGVIDLVRS